MIFETDACRCFSDPAGGGPCLRCMERRRARTIDGGHLSADPGGGPDIASGLSAGLCGSGSGAFRDRRLWRDSDGSAGAAGTQILADGRGCAAVSTAAGAFQPLREFGNASSRLYDNAGIGILASPAASHPRNLASSTAPSTQRQRSVLAELVASIEPERADEIADRLLAEFCTLSRLWSQSLEALERVLGPGSTVARLLLSARIAVLEAMQSDIAGASIDMDDPRMGQYLMTSMGALAEEALRILFLDGSRRLIADEQLQWGTLGQLALYPRTIFRRAMEHNAAGIILVHNHPSGDPSPSENDVRVTQMLIDLGRSLDVEIVDHIIVTSSEWQRVPMEGRERKSRRTDSFLPLRDASNSDVQDRSEAEVSALANAKRTVRRRMLRRQLIGAPSLFGEPAWDMLIDLFIHHCEGKTVSTSSLCIASGVPMSSALRMIQRLCDAELLSRRADPADGRRFFVELTPEVRQRMLAYFAPREESDLHLWQRSHRLDRPAR